MKELLNHFEYVKLLSYVYLMIIIITYVVHRFVRMEEWIKYIPGFILIIIGVYGFIRLITDDFWTKGVKNLMIILIGTSGGILGLLFGLVLGIYNKREKDKINENERNQLTN